MSVAGNGGPWVGETLNCYRCGASLAGLSLPLGRMEECPECTVQLHVCRMCRFYDPQVPKQCREDDAEEVRDKVRPNFCDYFKPSVDAYQPGFAAAESRSRSQLDALFGGGDSDGGGDDADGAAEDLFK